MYRRFFFTSISLLFLVGLITISIRELSNKSVINVIVITAESLPNELVNQQTMPQLIKQASHAYRFDNHRAISDQTGTNMVSLLSGLSPLQTTNQTRGQSLEPALFTPLEQLRTAGYQVEGVQDFMPIAPYKNLGLSIANTHDLRYALGLKKQRDEPFFIWYHYAHTQLPDTTTHDSAPVAKDHAQQEAAQQIHIPLVPTDTATPHHQATVTRDTFPTVRQRQKTSIAEFDTWLAELFIFLKKSGLKEHSIVIVTADHGGQGGERQPAGHDPPAPKEPLPEATGRIPLLIWLPPLLSKQVVHDEPMKPTDHRDLMPTILQFLGLTPVMTLDGAILFRHHTTTGEETTNDGSRAGPAAEQPFDQPVTTRTGGAMMNDVY